MPKDPRMAGSTARGMKRLNQLMGVPESWKSKGGNADAEPSLPVKAGPSVTASIEPDGEEGFSDGNPGQGVTLSGNLNLEANTLASDSASLTQCGRAESPPIASIDHAVARARLENDHDAKKMEKIVYFIQKFHEGVTWGKDDRFSDNVYLGKVRTRCRQALDEYLPDIGITDTRLLPLHEELLAMKYCHPREELDGAICGMLSDLGLLHLAQAFTNDFAPQGTVKKDGVDKAKGASHQEPEGNGTAKSADAIARLNAEVQSLKVQVKELATKKDAIRLTEEVRKKTDRQQQQAEDRMKAELAGTVAAASKKHEEAEAELRNEIAALNIELASQQKELKDLASKMEKPSPKLPPPPVRFPLKINTREATQKRKKDSLDAAESTSSKRPATELSKQAGPTTGPPPEASSRLRWGRG
jgi:hypothetical protein